MKFSRLAVQDDFDKALILYRDIPDDIKVIIKDDENYPKAFKAWINNYSTYAYGHNEIRKLCKEYRGYLVALLDFIDGIDVYVTYEGIEWWNYITRGN